MMDIQAKLPGKPYAFPYSNEFSRKLREYYLNAAKAEGHPNPESCVGGLLTREAFTMECRQKMPLALLARYQMLPNARVLEVGCGTGRPVVLFARADCSVTGIDIDLNALEVARARSQEDRVGVDLFPADGLHLPFALSSYDIVLCHNVLEHIPRAMHSRAVCEMARVLRPGGILFIQTPNRLSPIDIHTSRLPFLHWLPRSLAGLVKRLGVPAPHEELLSYNEILIAARDAASFEILNHCDVWEDLSDYRSHWVNYSNSFGLTAKLYFRLLPSAFIVSRIVRTELNKWLPALNLFLKRC